MDVAIYSKLCWITFFSYSSYVYWFMRYKLPGFCLELDRISGQFCLFVYVEIFIYFAGYLVSINNIGRISGQYIIVYVEFFFHLAKYPVSGKNIGRISGQIAVRCNSIPVRHMGFDKVLFFGTIQFNKTQLLSTGCILRILYFWSTGKEIRSLAHS